MPPLLSTLRRILDRQQKRAFIIVFIAAFFAALLEVISLGAVFALVLSLLKPDGQTAGLIGQGLTTVGVNPDAATPFWIGSIVIILYALKTGLSILLSWVRARASLRQNAVFGERLLAGYLAKPWTFFLGQHSTVLATRVTGHTYQLAVYVFVELAMVCAETLVVLFIFGFLIMLNPFLTLWLTAILGGLSLLMAFGLRSSNDRLARIKLAAEHAAATTVQTVLQGAREVLLNHSGSVFYHRYQQHIGRAVDAHVALVTWREVPRFVFEFGLVASFLGLLGVLLSRHTPADAVLSVAAVYAAASFRLMPSLGRLSQAAYHLRSSLPLLGEIADDLAQRPPLPANPQSVTPLGLRQDIIFDKVSYAYPGSGRPSLHGVSFRLHRNESLGVVGPTGAGKTTLMELLLGLLQPSSGTILIDGTPLTADRLPAWQASLGYVPQHLYLTEDSIRRNIAFGVADNNIDEEAVHAAARLAQMEHFIRTAMPQGFDTPVGERGVRLSGGQRQRLGIARALYRKPQVLLLDEATAALDTATEAAVTEALRGLAGQKTIVLIAHRLSTVRQCTSILALEDGTVTGQGSFDIMAANNTTVRRLLAAAQDSQ
ncbi:MAG: ABC transporter ATP-binding protein [Holosporales bacterium]|jgi:ABC-type multidrug transport system fused ATPase/permease subunit